MVGQPPCSQAVSYTHLNGKKNAPYLYDLMITHTLDWPSLTYQWFPDKESCAPRTPSTFFPLQLTMTTPLTASQQTLHDPSPAAGHPREDRWTTSRLRPCRSQRALGWARARVPPHPLLWSNASTFFLSRTCAHFVHDGFRIQFHRLRNLTRWLHRANRHSTRSSNSSSPTTSSRVSPGISSTLPADAHTTGIQVCLCASLLLPPYPTLLTRMFAFAPHIAHQRSR